MTTTKSAYSQKLLDPRWQKKRLDVLQRDEFTCQKCFNNKSTLHVHHRRYFPNKEPWDIDIKFLVTLCEDCHQEETDLLPEVTHDIVQILKEKFYAQDIKEIAAGLLNVSIYYDSAVTASIIEYWLSDADNFKELGDRYFKYLAQKNGNDSIDVGEPSLPCEDAF